MQHAFGDGGGDGAAGGVRAGEEDAVDSLAQQLGSGAAAADHGDHAVLRDTGLVQQASDGQAAVSEAYSEGL